MSAENAEFLPKARPQERRQAVIHVRLAVDQRHVDGEALVGDFARQFHALHGHPGQFVDQHHRGAGAAPVDGLHPGVVAVEVEMFEPVQFLRHVLFYNEFASVKFWQRPFETLRRHGKAAKLNR